MNEQEHRHMVSHYVSVARSYPIGDYRRAAKLDDARKHYVQANNLAWRARLASGIGPVSVRA